MPSILDALAGGTGAMRLPNGVLSSLATPPLTMPPMIPQNGLGTPAYGVAADQADGTRSTLPSIRLGSPTGGLAPGNGWGDAPRTPALPNAGTMSMPGGPVAPAATDGDQHHSFFSQGGAAQTIAGILGDALLVGTNHAPMYAPIIAQRQQEASRARLQASQQAAELDRQKQLADYNRDHDRQVVNFGGGGIGQWDANNGLTILRQPDAPEPRQTPLQQNVSFLGTLDPNMTDAQKAEIVRRGIQGYQYDPTVMGQRQTNALQLVDERAAQARATKGTPTYTNTHPKASGGGGIGGGGAAGGLSTAAILAALGKK